MGDARVRASTYSNEAGLASDRWLLVGEGGLATSFQVAVLRYSTGWGGNEANLGCVSSNIYARSRAEVCMLNLTGTEVPKQRSVGTAAVSAVVHVVVVLALVGVWKQSQKIAPFKLPGTAQGTRLLTYYAAGSPPHAVSDLQTKEKPKVEETSTTHAAIEAPKLKKVEAAAPAAAVGTGNSADSGLGEGDIHIALQTYNPYPKVSVPRGTVGDVILNAVIDEHGKIASLTLIKGLGQSIDETVEATVRQWSFSPATRNGVAIPSEQELHFHYEARG